MRQAFPFVNGKLNVRIDLKEACKKGPAFKGGSENAELSSVVVVVL